VFNESDKIVNDQKEVANHLNNFFSTVDENIGKYTAYDPSVHPSLIEIKKQNDCTNTFVFEKVTTDKVEFTILSDSLNTIVCSPLDPFFEKNGLIVFQKSPDFVPPEQRSKKYVFIDFLFNLVTKFLCFLNFSQFLLL
jgi:hypothetical protein